MIQILTRYQEANQVEQRIVEIAGTSSDNIYLKASKKTASFCMNQFLKLANPLGLSVGEESKQLFLSCSFLFYLLPLSWQRIEQYRSLLSCSVSLICFTLENSRKAKWVFSWFIINIVNNGILITFHQSFQRNYQTQ